MTRLRAITLFWGAITLFWLGLEDTDMLKVAVLGAGISALAVLWEVLHMRPLARLSGGMWWVALASIGGVIGGGGVIATVALMFFKTAWHSHIFPDFPPEMLSAMLERLPAWGIAGACLGMAWGIWHTPNHEQPQ